jgi:dipeptidyl aminopeptidase/acylaminoacyl peptidase
MAIVCASQIPSGHQLALVTLRGVQGVVVRDVTDIGHPVTRCGFSGGSNFRFITETRVSYIVTSSGLGSPGALYMVDLQTQTTSLVRKWASGGYGSWVYAWSPDGRALTYLDSTPTGVLWHMLSAAGDVTLSPTLGTTVARGISPDNDDAWVGFSADGQYVAVEETFTAGGQPGLQIHRYGNTAITYSRRDATMATWGATGARLYFRSSVGVQVWETTGKVQSVAAGLIWIHPWPSADGNHIAYTTLNAQGNHQVGIMDTSAANVTQASNEPRSNPGFLTPTLVWYAGEVLCTTTTPCGFGGPGLTGQTYVYDIAGVESGSIDTAFYDSWPHVSGQS